MINKNISKILIIDNIKYNYFTFDSNFEDFISETIYFFICFLTNKNIICSKTQSDYIYYLKQTLTSELQLIYPNIQGLQIYTNLNNFEHPFNIAVLLK